MKRRNRSIFQVGRLAAAYVACALLAWLLLARFADRWWPVSLLMFGPRWLLLLPAMLLGPWALLRRHWRALLGVLGAAAVVAWPVMGWNWAGLWPDNGATRDLRIITFNIGNNNRTREHRVDLEDLRRLYDVARADVLVLEECTYGKDALFPVFPDAHLLAIETLCAVSRWPMANIEARPRGDLESLGGNGVIVSFEVELPHAKFSVLALHLATQRQGLEEVLAGSPDSVAAMREKMLARRLDSEAALAWSLRSPLPLVVVGDFNMPVESGIYKDRWGAYGNAFSQCGFGYGYTKFERRFRVRIDHVLYDRAWRCLSAEVDESLGGDHRPLIADLKLQR